MSRTKSGAATRWMMIVLAIALIIGSTIGNEAASAEGTSNTNVSQQEQTDGAIDSLWAKTKDLAKSVKGKISEAEFKELLAREPVYVTLKDKWFSPDYYVRILDEYDALPNNTYLYYGDLKKNRPNGKGILLTVTAYASSYGKVFSLLYAGKFKAGVYNGYGIKYNKASDYYSDETIQATWDHPNTPTLDELGAVYPVYEGNFKKGKYDGNGKYMMVKEKIELDAEKILERLLLGGPSAYLTEYYQANERLIKQFNNELYHGNGVRTHISRMPLLDTYVAYEGKYKKNKLNGKGTEYNLYGDVHFVGSFKNGAYSGKGKLYYANRQLRYEGKFKSGEFNGKGTLYNEDGTVKYKGKWKNGELAG